MAFSTHPAIGQNLRNCVFGGSSLLKLISATHGLNKVLGMVVGDELEGVRDALDEVVLFDLSHGFSLKIVRFAIF